MPVQLGMIGLGRMGAAMVRRLQRGGHECVAYNEDPAALDGVTGAGAVGTTSLRDFVNALAAPRTVWLMIPAAAVDGVIGALAPLLQQGDTVIDGGNSWYVDDLRRASELGPQGIHYIDVGTSGGVWGEERGYCLMIGGERSVVEALHPLFRTLAPGRGDIARTPAREAARSTAEEGYLHCGGVGAGHFVKMIHNAIEYGLMAAYAEGFNILRGANAGASGITVDAETAPLRDPERYRYELDLPEIAELWRRGSVISSWLLDLTAASLAEQRDLANFSGTVADSGEARWAVAAAIDEGAPAPVLTTALYQRFASRGNDDFANRLLSAMRFAFGGHVERKHEP
jgi:6-phosphogluconate dehydrogenase